MIRRVISAGLFWLACGSAMAQDALLSRLDQIGSEMGLLSEGMISGAISMEQAVPRMEALSTLDLELRSGAVAPEAVRSLSWKHHEGVPAVTAGASLVLTGVPDGFAGPVTARFADGTLLSIRLMRDADDPVDEMIVGLGMPDGGIDVGGEVTLFLGGDTLLGALRVDLVPVTPIEGALPLLMRVLASNVATNFEVRGVDPKALLEQLRQAPETVPADRINGAMLLWMWSEAGRGDPLFSFLRTGQFDSAFWAGEGVTPPDADRVNSFASSVLQDMAALPQIMEPAVPVLQDIRYDVPADGRVPAIRANVETPGLLSSVAEINSIGDIGPALETGRFISSVRTQWVSGLKTTQKGLEWVVGWDPATGIALSMAGAALTLAEQQLRAEEHGYPKTIELSATPGPAASLLADDARRMAPKATITAKGEPYTAYVLADGVDVALLAVDMGLLTLDLVSNSGALGKAKTVYRAGRTATEAAEKAAVKQLQDFTQSRLQALTKDGVETYEKYQSTVNKSTSWEIKKTPARVWQFPVNEQTDSPYFSIVYNGAVRWTTSSFSANACWNGTNLANSTLTTKPEYFAGKFARADVRWEVQTPQLDVRVAPPLMRPGESALVTTLPSGAEPTRAQFVPPADGFFRSWNASRPPTTRLRKSTSAASWLACPSRSQRMLRGFARRRRALTRLL